MIAFEWSPFPQTNPPGRHGSKSTHCLQVPVHAIEPPSILYLTPGVLASDWQVHGVPSTSVGARVPQPLNVLLDLSAQVVFEFQGIQVRRKVEDLSLRQLADFHRTVEVEARHDTGARVSPDSEKRLEGPPDETVLGEVDSQNEDHDCSSTAFLVMQL